MTLDQTVRDAGNNKQTGLRKGAEMLVLVRVRVRVLVLGMQLRLPGHDYRNETECRCWAGRAS